MSTATGAPARSTGSRGSALSSYGIAIASVAVALLVTLALNSPEIRGPLFIPAIMLSAWYGGTVPGLFAAGLSILGIHFFLLPPRLTPRLLTPEDAAYLVVFGLSALLVAWLTGRQQRSDAAVRRAHDELAARVKELGQTNEQLRAEIVERERAEEEVRRQASLLDLTHDTVFVRDLDNVIGYWNHAATELLGWSQEEALGKVTHQLLQTMFPAPLEEIESELFRAGHWEGELIHTKRDGTQIVVASRWSVLRDEQGQAVRILETNNDITERKRAEAALRESEERWRAAFENNPTMYFMIEPTGTTLSVNPFGAQQLGYTVDELVGKSVLNVFPESERAAAMEHVANCLAHIGQSMSWEIRKIRKDRTTLWVRETARAVQRPNDQPIILIACEDITERRRAEDALRRSESYLAEAQRLSRIGSFGWSVSTGEIYWSDETYRIFQYDRTITPTVELALQRTHPDDAAFVKQTIERASQEGKDVEFEHRLLMPDGSVKYVYVVAHAVAEPKHSAHAYRDVRPNGSLGRPHRLGHPDLDEDGELVEYIGTIMDFTERRRAEQALQTAQAELARLTRVTMVGEITASIAHEVNQPLSAIVLSGNACRRWLDADPPDLDEARTALQRIIANGNRASEVIRRIRSLLQRQMPERTSLNVNELVRDTLALTRGELERHRVSVRIALQPNLPRVVGDRVGLQQVLVNLILNGIDAMAGVGESGRVLAFRSHADETGGVVVEVQDSGKGLDAEHCGRIFDAFFSTKPAGLGMGLSISRSIVEAHGGRLWATPGNGAGAMFRFSLPVEAGGES